MNPDNTDVFLSVCMIVRDSSRTLRECLESILPWADELVVVDTGSLDDTPQIVEQYGARLFRFPWVDDFAAARNESLRHARGKWLFWMDSDDTIPADCGRRLRQLARADHPESLLGFVMQVHCPGGQAARDQVTIVDHVKLIRNSPNIRFEGRIHEQVLSSIRSAGGDVAWTDIYVLHSGADQSPAGRKKKFDRDLRLLQLDLQDRPDHPFVLFNLGMTFNDMQSHAAAVHWLRRSLAFSLPDESHVRKAYALLIQSLIALGWIPDAQLVSKQALSLFPDDPELWFRRGLLDQQTSRLNEALQAYNQAIWGESQIRFSSRDPGIQGYKARHNMALVYSSLGRNDLAELQWRRVVHEQPHNREGWRGLRQVLVAQRRIAAMSAECSALKSMPMLMEEWACWQGEVHLARNEREAAECVLAPFIDREGDFDMDVANLQCRICFDAGHYSQAVKILEQIVAADPEDAAAHHNLGQARLNSGDLERARQSLQRSLELRPAWPATLKSLEEMERAFHQQHSQ